EGDEEREHRARRSGKTAVPALEPPQHERDQEERREDVRQRQIPADGPVHLGERDREHGREEQPFNGTPFRAHGQRCSAVTATIASTTRAPARPSTSPTTS